MWIFVPIGNSTVAFVGIEKVFAVATFIVTNLSASASTAVYEAVLPLILIIILGSFSTGDAPKETSDELVIVLFKVVPAKVSAVIAAT